MQIVNAIAKGTLIPLVFMQADAAASQNNAALTVAEVRDVAASADDQNAADGYVMPWTGEIIGISVRSSAARTNGTLTAEAMVNTSATGLTAALNATNTQSAYTRQARGNDTFAAGDRIGARLTTDASWAPATADIVIVVWALVYLDMI